MFKKVTVIIVNEISFFHITVAVCNRFNCSHYKKLCVAIQMLINLI